MSESQISMLFDFLKRVTFYTSFITEMKAARNTTTNTNNKLQSSSSYIVELQWLEHVVTMKYVRDRGSAS